jgi:TonB family protein
MFQEALIESLPRRTYRVRPVLASASVHIAVLGTVAWISLQAIGEISDPPETIIFRVGFSPPPLGDGSVGDRPVKVRLQLARIPHAMRRSELFQPTSQVSVDGPRLAQADLPDSHDETETGSADRNEGFPGDRKGIEGGTGQQSVTDVGPERYVYEISKTPGVTPPTLAARIDPVYPEAARKLNLSGITVLQATIDASGRVIDLRVVKSAGNLLDAAAIAAVEKWIYRPATYQGRSVAVFLSVTVDFELH